jgi:hypothetical protein
MFSSQRAFQIALAVAACVALNGCVPVLVGGAIYHSSQTNSQRAGFNGEFQKNNLEREVKGLKPLDWCTEAYKFDAGWAKDKPECTERVTRYESGDRSALSM